MILTPDTILVWHRKVIARKWDYSNSGSPGRPRVADEIARLTVRMAQEKPGWGYIRRSEAPNSVWATHWLKKRSATSWKEYGIVAAPKRRKRVPWSPFLNIEPGL